MQSETNCFVLFWVFKYNLHSYRNGFPTSSDVPEDVPHLIQAKHSHLVFLAHVCLEPFLTRFLKVPEKR